MAAELPPHLESSQQDSPVLTYRLDPLAPGPAALLIGGALDLRQHCLHYGDRPVVWPEGTGWDETEQCLLYRGEGGERRIQANARLEVGLGGGWVQLDVIADRLTTGAYERLTKLGLAGSDAVAMIA